MHVGLGILCREFNWTGGMELVKIYARAFAGDILGGKRIVRFIVLNGHASTDTTALASPAGARVPSAPGREYSLQEFCQALSPQTADQGPQLSFDRLLAEVLRDLDLSPDLASVILAPELSGALVEQLYGRGVTALLGKEPPNPKLPMPFVGYLWDFQHRYLWQNFSRQECFRREIMFARILSGADVVVTNARQVAQDVERFYPWMEPGKVFATPFAPPLAPPRAEGGPACSERVRQAAAEPFFLVANQFWLHKDHLTAFRAIQRIAQRRPIRLLCTGVMHDERDPQHIERLKAFIAEHHLEETIALMGFVSSPELRFLMEACLAVIQPTHFEGGPGGGAVYLATGLGVRSLVSDLPVNREADHPLIRFFRVGDAEDLAGQMEELLDAPPPPVDRAMVAAFVQERTRLLGDTLQRAVERARLNFGSDQREARQAAGALP